MVNRLMRDIQVIQSVFEAILSIKNAPRRRPVVVYAEFLRVNSAAATW